MTAARPDPRRPDLRVVLATATYPAGPGEEFLATELPYLAAAFEHVTVVPSQLEGDVQPVPPGVTVDPRWSATYGRLGPARVPDVLAGARTPAWWSDLVRRWPLTAHKVTLRQSLLYTRRARAFERWLVAALPPWPGPTVYYSYWLGPLTYGAARAHRRLGRAVVVTRAHGGDLFEDRYSPPYLPLRHATLAGADAVWPVSDAGRATLLRDHPWLAERCATMRLGVGDPGADGRASTDGTLRVVTCARCRPVKRLERVVAGLAALAGRPGAPQVEWDHYGDGATRPALTAQAAATLPPTVRWTFHGQVSNVVVRQHYAARPVDVFLNTSASEGVSVALMEAQSYGIPCVATAVGGTPEIVDDTNGVLLPADAGPEAIADGLARLCPGAPGAAARRAASKASWHSRYRADANYPAFVAQLAACADRR